MHEQAISRDLWSAVADSVRGYAIVALDADGHITGWNPAAEHTTGFRESDVLGQPVSRLFTPTDAAQGRPEALLQDAAASGSADLAGWRMRSDGSTFWAEGVITALRGEAGVTGFVMVLRDRTEQHLALEQLHFSATQFEGILAIATDAVVCVDDRQKITFFNQGAERIFGYRADEVLGEPLDLLVPGASRPAHADQVRQFAASPTVARRMGERGGITGLRKNGEVFPAEASISKLEVGGTRVYTAVLRDVTERRRAEEALARQAEELARSNAELEQFAYVASHDLQEPLRMVASYTQLLAKRYGGSLDADAHEFIDYAVDGVTRMQSLINDLLAYSRVGTRGGTLQVVEATAVLERVLSHLRPTIEESGATVTYDPLPSVTADPGQLSQVFQNLIGNAIKFHGDAPPRVHLSAREEDDEWVFSVQDNGIGIAPEFQDRIFIIFQRLHSRAEYPGTGIGLAICKKIIERHGGRIWLDSEPGKGTTFFFSLPDRS